MILPGGLVVNLPPQDIALIEENTQRIERAKESLMYNLSDSFLESKNIGSLLSIISRQQKALEECDHVLQCMDGENYLDYEQFKLNIQAILDGEI